MAATAESLPRVPALTARQGLEKLATYPYVILTWVDDDGYPLSVAVTATIEPASGTARFLPPGRPRRARRGRISA